MTSVAMEAQEIAFGAACPYEANESLKARKNRAAANLRRFGLRNAYARVERAWKGRAGPSILRDMQVAYERLSLSRVAARLDDTTTARLRAAAEALHAIDPMAFGSAVSAIRRCVGDPDQRRGLAGGEADPNSTLDRSANGQD